MTYEEVIEELKSMENPRYSGDSFLYKDSDKTLGIGVTKIKKLAKTIKRDHDRALKLWDTPLFEAKLLAIFTEEPKKVSSEQIDEQIPNSKGFMLADYYSSEILVKTKFIDEKILKWTKSNDHHIKKAGYAALYAKAKLDKKADPEFFKPFLTIIEKEIQNAENWVKESMNYGLMYIGTVSRELNSLCIDICDSIGEVKVDYGKTSCITVDAKKHLLSPNVHKKL